MSILSYLAGKLGYVRAPFVTSETNHIVREIGLHSVSMKCGNKVSEATFFQVEPDWAKSHVSIKLEADEAPFVACGKRFLMTIAEITP